MYDFGASGVRATIVSFHTVPTEAESKVKTKSTKTSDVTHVTVLGFGSDRVASGNEMDLRLREFLQEKFESAHAQGASISDEKRAVAKLWKEANRVKTVLSANTESRVSVGYLFVYSMTVTMVLMAVFADRLNHSITISTSVPQ